MPGTTTTRPNYNAMLRLTNDSAGSLLGLEDKALCKRRRASDRIDISCYNSNLIILNSKSKTCNLKTQLVTHRYCRNKTEWLPLSLSYQEISNMTYQINFMAIHNNHPPTTEYGNCSYCIQKWRRQKIRQQAGFF